MVGVKISLGFFFLKIFSTIRWRRYLIYGVVALSTLFGIIMIIMSAVTCALDPTRYTQHACSTHDSFDIVNAAWSIVNALTDLVFCLISILALWNANMKRGTKILASSLLACGTLGGISSCVRVVFLLGGGPSEDVQTRQLTILKMSNLEAGICIVVASLATLRPLLQALFTLPYSWFESATKSCSDNKTTRTGIEMEDGRGTHKVNDSVAVNDLDDEMPPGYDYRCSARLQTHDLV